MTDEAELPDVWIDTPDTLQTERATSAFGWPTTDGSGFRYVPAARLDALRVELESAKRDAERLRALAATRQAINRAASDLPEGVEIIISVEKGAACVYLHSPNGARSFDVDADDRLPDEINAAIDAARKDNSNGT